MHHHILNINGNFIANYMEDRQIDKELLAKSTGLGTVTLRKITENTIPLRFVAFYRISKVLGIEPEMVITDNSLLNEYNEYLREHEKEIKMTKFYYKMSAKRSSTLEKQFRELMEEL